MASRIRGSTSAYLHGLTHSIVTPFETLPPRWRPEDTLILMLRKENFIPGPKKWSDFADDVIHQSMMELVLFLARALTKENIGSNNDSLYVEGGTPNDPNGIPKVGFASEDLFSKHGFWEGLRVWIHINDPEYNCDTAVKRLLEENKYLDEQRTGKKKYSRPQCYRRIFKLDDYVALLKLYAPKHFKNFSFDAQNNPNDPFFSDGDQTRNSRLSLYNILKPENAFCSISEDEDGISYVGYHTEGICEEQLDINNYFDLDQRAKTFRSYPRPDYTYRHFTNFFTPDKLYDTPLPGNLSQTVLKQYNDNKAKIRATRDELDEVEVELMGIFGDTEETKRPYRALLERLKAGAIPANAHEDHFWTLCCKKKDLLEYMARLKDESSTLPLHNMIKIAQLALEDTDEVGKLMLNSEMMQASFAEKNDIIKLRLENDKTWEKLEEDERKQQKALERLRDEHFVNMSHDEYLAEKDRLYSSYIEAHIHDHEEVRKRYNAEYIRNKRALLERAVGGEEAADNYITSKRDIYDAVFNPNTKTDRTRELMERLTKDVWTKVTTSSKLTASLINGRNWFLSLDPSKHFVDLTLKYKNMSIFGNMIIDLTRDLDKVKQLDNQFQLTALMYLNMMCTYHYTLGSDTQSKSTIKPNLFITGDAGVGKSFAMKSAGEFGFPGSSSSSVHFSEHAFSTGANMDQIHYLCEETPYWMIGIGKDGKPIPINPILKQRLASGVITTQVYRKNAEGVPETVTTVTPASTSGTYASNPATSDATNGPFAQRVVAYSVMGRKRVRLSADCDAKYSREPKIMRVLAKEVEHGYHLQHFYLMLWETLITARAIPYDINIDELNMNGDLIFDYFKTRGINSPSDRHTAMSGELCRAATMMNGIRTEFFSEVGIHHRRDNLGNPKPFDVLIMLDLIKYGCASKEISLFVLSLMENAWIPYTKIKIANICCRELTVLKNGQASFMEVEKHTENGMVKELDKRYIAIEDTHDNAILARIQTYMKEKPSLADLGSCVRSLTNDTIDSYDYEFYDPVEYPRQKVQHEIEEVLKSLNSLAKDAYLESAGSITGEDLGGMVRNMTLNEDSNTGIPGASSGDEGSGASSEDEVRHYITRTGSQTIPMTLFMKMYIRTGIEIRKKVDNLLFDTYIMPIINRHPNEVYEQSEKLESQALFQLLSKIPRSALMSIESEVIKLTTMSKVISKEPETEDLLKKYITLESLHYYLAKSEQLEKDRRTSTARIVRNARPKGIPASAPLVTQNPNVRQHAIAAAAAASQQLIPAPGQRPLAPAQANQAVQPVVNGQSQATAPDFLVFEPRFTSSSSAATFNQYAQLMIKIGSTLKNIECAKQVTDFKTRRRKLYIAVVLKDMDVTNVMREALKRVEHRFQEEKICITGLTYERNTPDGKKESMYQVFDVIRLSPKGERLMSIGNKASMDQHTIDVYKDDFGIRIDPDEVRNSSLCNMDTEQVHFSRYWESCGLPETKETHLGCPEIAAQQAWYNRYNHPFYKDRQHSILESYPEDYIAILDEEKKKAAEMKDMAAKERMLKEKKNLYSDSISVYTNDKKKKRAGVIPHMFPRKRTQEEWNAYFGGVNVPYNGPVSKAVNRPVPVRRQRPAIPQAVDPADLDDMII